MMSQSFSNSCLHLLATTTFVIGNEDHWVEELYVHFASCFYIDIYCIMGCYYTLCHNTYAFSLLFYMVYMKRENASSWNSGLEKEQILETYSAQLQKSRNFTEISFAIYKKYWAKKAPEEGHQSVTRVGGALPPGCAPCLMGPLVALRCPSFSI